MSRFKRVVFSALLISLILLAGCQHLVIDTGRILKSDINLPEIVGIIAGFGTTFAAFRDFFAMLKRRSSLGMKPENGCDHGSIPDLVGLLRPAYRFAAGDYLECYCRFHQFSHGWGVGLFSG